MHSDRIGSKQILMKSYFRYSQFCSISLLQYTAWGGCCNTIFISDHVQLQLYSPLLKCIARDCCCYFTCSTMFIVFNYGIGSHLLAQFQVAPMASVISKRSPEAVVVVLHARQCLQTCFHGSYID